MSQNIYYNGSFKKEELLGELIEEVRDIAQIYNWEYTVYKNRFPQNTLGKAEYDGELYGISYTPQGTEAISFTFLSNGKMCGAARLKRYGDAYKGNSRLYSYLLRSKIENAESDTHEKIIQLFNYLSDKYLDNFNLTSDGEYW